MTSTNQFENASRTLCIALGIGDDDYSLKLAERHLRSTWEAAALDMRERAAQHIEDLGHAYMAWSAWAQISPTGDEGGLLCPSCLCHRLAISGIRCKGAFMSGPIVSVRETEMVKP